MLRLRWVKNAPCVESARKWSCQRSKRILLQESRKFCHHGRGNDRIPAAVISELLERQLFVFRQVTILVIHRIMIPDKIAEGKFVLLLVFHEMRNEEGQLI